MVGRPEVDPAECGGQDAPVSEPAAPYWADVAHSQESTAVKISILTPCFNEEASVRMCAEAVASVMRESLAEYDYEHVFCDNASTDDTVKILREMAATDPRIK